LPQWRNAPVLSAVARRLFLPLAAAGLVAFVSFPVASSGQEPGIPVVRDSGPNITICHATSSDKNPYVQIQVDADSIVKENGHDSHPEDIIPPCDYIDHGVTKHYPGKNWPAKTDIWLNGCEIPRPPTPELTPAQSTVQYSDDNRER